MQLAFINTCIAEVSYLLCFLLILKKISYFTVVILGIRTTFTCMLCSLKLEKTIWYRGIF